MSKKKESFCGYPECRSQIKTDSGNFEVIFRSIETPKPPQAFELKQVNFFLCHKHAYELAAVVRLFDQKVGLRILQYQ